MGLVLGGLGVVAFEVYVWGRRRKVVVAGADQARLQVDDVFAERVVLGLDLLVGVFEGVEFADLLFELLDVAFLALAECALGWVLVTSIHFRIPHTTFKTLSDL